MLSEDEKLVLLQIARESIMNYKNVDINSYNLSKFLMEKKGCFVTLTINKELRGCIGYINPVKTLIESVIDNAFNAAYKDFRFLPLNKNEFEKVKIEISVLSVPKKIEYKSVEDLKSKIQVFEDGIIISDASGFHSATFLPQVWDQLNRFEDFFSHLCLKAGLKSDEWTRGNLVVEKYNVEKFEEN